MGGRQLWQSRRAPPLTHPLLPSPPLPLPPLLYLSSPLPSPLLPPSIAPSPPLVSVLFLHSIYPRQSSGIGRAASLLLRLLKPNLRIKRQIYGRCRYGGKKSRQHGRGEEEKEKNNGRRTVKRSLAFPSHQLKETETETEMVQHHHIRITQRCCATGTQTSPEHHHHHQQQQLHRPPAAARQRR